MSDCQITGSSFYLLKRLPSLRSVEIPAVACRHVGELASTRIDTLSVTGGKLSEGDIGQIAELSQLLRLELGYVTVSAGHLRHLAAASRLNEVMIWDVENSDSVEGALRKIGLIVTTPVQL